MISRNKVRIKFIVDEIYVFTASCIASVDISETCQEILDIEYCEDIEDFEDVEFVEVLSDDIDEDSIPNEEDITEEDIQEILKVSLT